MDALIKYNQNNKFTKNTTKQKSNKHIKLRKLILFSLPILLTSRIEATPKITQNPILFNNTSSNIKLSRVKRGWFDSFKSIFGGLFDSITEKAYSTHVWDEAENGPEPCGWALLNRANYDELDTGACKRNLDFFGEQKLIFVSTCSP